MPVAAFVNRSATLEKLIDESIQWCDDFIASLYGESAARTKVVLDVDDQQRLFGFSHGFIECYTSCIMNPNEVAERIWRKDAALWKSDPDSTKLTNNSPGWLIGIELGKDFRIGLEQ